MNDKAMVVVFVARHVWCSCRVSQVTIVKGRSELSDLIEKVQIYWSSVRVLNEEEGIKHIRRKCVLSQINLLLKINWD